MVFVVTIEKLLALGACNDVDVSIASEDGLLVQV